MKTFLFLKYNRLFLKVEKHYPFKILLKDKTAAPVIIKKATDMKTQAMVVIISTPFLLISLYYIIHSKS